MSAKKNKKIANLERTLNTWFSKYLGRITFAQKTFFVDHLRTMISAGLSLVESLDILAKEMTSEKFRLIIKKIKKDVEKGNKLSTVLSKYPKIFPPMYVKMIDAGEQAGKLEESLEQIVIQMKKSQELIRSIRGAMIYPAVILVAMGGIGILMTTVVLPKLMTLFEEFDADLPLATRVLMSIVNFLSNPLNLVLIFLSTAIIVFLFVSGLKRSPTFKKGIHSINLHLPIIGPVIKQVNLAKFSLTLSSLLKSTIPIIEAVDIAGSTCTNVLYQRSLHKTAKELRKGKPLSSILAKYAKLFPPMVTEMIMVGEKSGEVDHLLDELSNFYSSEVDKTMKNFSTIIEPVIILLLGVAVAGVAVAVVMPMFSLVQNF